MKLNNILTPQVRLFLYGAVAALLSVATAKRWITDDLAKSIQDNIPTIIGAISSIIAAANVKPKAVAPVTPVMIPAPVVPDRVDAVMYKPQAAAVEIA